MKIILDVIENTGITATAGIGTNLYLCKVAIDILAKHIPADENGVRIAELDEMTYRQTMWSHQPLTDFWRVGRGYAKKLEAHGMFTMGDVARMSVCNEDLLYQLFGTIRGAGNPVPSKRLRHIIPVKTALVPVRFCIARIPQKGLGWC